MAGRELTVVVIAGALAIALGLSPNPVDAIHRFTESMFGPWRLRPPAAHRLPGQRWFLAAGLLLVALGLIQAIWR